MSIEEQFDGYVKANTPGFEAATYRLIKMIDKKFEALENRLGVLEEGVIDSLGVDLVEIKKGDLLEYPEHLIIKVIDECGCPDG
jgi:hypothetical protein